ncbi:MAG: SET domain-containing protein-lysine N-methyltransferase [Chitinophagales bacterium]
MKSNVNPHRIDLLPRELRVCVLQPDYSTSDVDYQYYDPPRSLEHLLPDAHVVNLFLNKLSVYKQLLEASKEGYDIYINLCEGYLEWAVPSIEVYYYLELLQLPFTGPGSKLFDPPKELMKYVAFCEGVLTPQHEIIRKGHDIEKACAHLHFPMFVKPAKAGDSLGVDRDSLVHDADALQQKVDRLLSEYTEVLVEEYIAGREFTVLVVADAEDPTQAFAYAPVEYIFPEGNTFKTYALKTSALHPDANVRVDDPVLAAELQHAAKRIFHGFSGVGYARLDFRMNKRKEIFFLEINFTCSVFYPADYAGSADHILLLDGAGQDGFLRAIIAEGLARHRRKIKPFRLEHIADKGYGIFATRQIHAGEVIFKGEGKAQRLVTLREVENRWPEKEKLEFRRYAYPVSAEVFILWDDDPAAWAPQNHSCVPNTAYDGLNVVASTDIKPGEELTLDYATFLDEHMEPFTCHCGHPECRGKIHGTKGMSIDAAEKQKRT